MNTSNPPHIIVIGAVAVDIKAQSFGDLTRHGDVPGHTHVNVGGVARNMAKNLALLGARVTMVSVVGDDEFGRMIRADLRDANVNVANLRTIPNQHTATWVGILNILGDLDVGIFGGEIFTLLTPHIIDECATQFSRADLIAVDATIPRATIDAVIAIAKANHVPVYLNPASVARAQTVADCIGDFAIITANALEAQVLCPSSAWSNSQLVESAARVTKTLVERGVQRAIVTLGADGIVYADANETRYAPAHSTTIIDTTGAGDALAAMFLLCHLQKRPLHETLDRALDAAAMTAACIDSVNPNIGDLVG
jgi:pseudouridine kinase